MRALLQVFGIVDAAAEETALSYLDLIGEGFLLWLWINTLLDKCKDGLDLQVPAILLIGHGNWGAGRHKPIIWSKDENHHIARAKALKAGYLRRFRLGTKIFRHDGFVSQRRDSSTGRIAIRTEFGNQ